MSASLELWVYMVATRLGGERLIQKLRLSSKQANLTPDRFQERLGRATKPRQNGRLVWLHARDVKSILPLFEVIEQLNEQELGLNFLVTTRRNESVDDLANALPKNTIHQFSSIDLDAPIQGFLDHWRPDIAIISEGEFWPRMLTEIGKRDLSMISINARITDKSFWRWLWLPGMTKSVLNNFDQIFVQDQNVAQKLKRLGARPEKIRVTGSMTSTKKLMSYNEDHYSNLSSAIGSRSVWLAAATNKDEEDVVVNAHKVAMRRNRRLLLILLTREKKRGKPISARHENQNLSFALEEENEMLDDTVDVYVSGQTDELATYMRLASVTFCGGTLSNGETIDPFHPATMGSAIIHGPACGEYKEDFYRYRDAGAAQLATNGGQLAKTLSAAIAPDVAATMAHAAWEISSEGGEVSGIIISEILEKLAERA